MNHNNLNKNIKIKKDNLIYKNNLNKENFLKNKKKKLMQTLISKI